MSNPILGLRTTIYIVPDIYAAKHWYAKAFNTQPYFDELFYVGFNVAGYELGLQPGNATYGDNVISYWGVDDVNTQYHSLLMIGATKHEEPQNVGGEIVVASVKDPLGNIIGLIYNPEFKLDK
ncbi:MAG: VOC family protein [Sphingobacteriaceae bacterium]|nr:MAG: VOC family protein [Sphingobacteriaceae bacterium]